MKRLTFPPILMLLLSSLAAHGAESPLLPEGHDYDPAITTPAEYLGYRVGERHMTHHELVGYLRLLGEQSDRVRIIPYGTTHLHRPLMQLLISSPENLRQSEDLRQQQLSLTEPSESSRLDFEGMPVVMNINYGVHGNEPSASNTAPLMAYHLAAARDAETRASLEKLVILLDPCLNPDGFDRFAHWVRNHVGQNPNPDPLTLEHREAWPGSRTNAYFFDLNRDWMLLTQPESRGRLELYHRWMPSLVLDFHEMGTDSTYFFQPGVPERTHPLIPSRVYELTGLISEYFAAALDESGSPYFTRERFDDFYMGKGSTISDMKGAVGILFEQGSARGQVQESENGLLYFRDAIRNQFTISRAILEAAMGKRVELLENTRSFFREHLEAGKRAGFAGYRFASPDAPARAREFASILEAHRITVLPLAEESGYFVPAAQPHFGYLEALVEDRTEFEQNLFYDITAWSLPRAYNLQWERVSRKPETVEAPPPADPDLPESDLGYLVDWNSLYAPRVLLDLLEAEVLVKAGSAPFTLGGEAFGYGALFVPVNLQPEAAGTIHQILKEGVRAHGVRVVPVSSFLTEKGIDLGSNRFDPVRQPRILLIAAAGVDAYEAGTIWHLLDYLHDYPVTLIRPGDLNWIDLDDYTALILPDARPGTVSDQAAERLDRWVRQGGVIAALGRSARWTIDKELVSLTLKANPDGESAGDQQADSPKEAKPVERRPFDKASDDRALEQIRGAIFKAEIDRSHPLLWGYASSELPVFVEGEVFIAPSPNPYQTPMVFAGQPLLSGYASPKNLEAMAGSAAAVVEGKGQGSIILFGHTPTFRAYWRGTEKILLNAILFGDRMQAGRAGGY